MSNIRNDEIADIADVFGALSNPNRLRLFLRLVECCGATGARCEDGMGACVGELAKGLDIAPSTVSHHLKELRQCGLIVMHRKGRTIECHARPDMVTRIAGVLTDAA